MKESATENLRIYAQKLAPIIQKHSKLSLGFLSARFPFTTNIVLPTCLLTFGLWKAIKPEFEVLRTRIFYFTIAGVCCGRLYFLRAYKPIFYAHTSKLMALNSVVFAYLAVKPTSDIPRVGITEREQERLDTYNNLKYLAQVQENTENMIPKNINYFNFKEKLAAKKALDVKREDKEKEQQANIEVVNNSK